MLNKQRNKPERCVDVKQTVPTQLVAGVGRLFSEERHLVRYHWFQQQGREKREHADVVSKNINQECVSHFPNGSAWIPVAHGGEQS